MATLNQHKYFVVNQLSLSSRWKKKINNVDKLINDKYRLKRPEYSRLEKQINWIITMLLKIPMNGSNVCGWLNVILATERKCDNCCTPYTENMATYHQRCHKLHPHTTLARALVQAHNFTMQIYLATKNHYNRNWLLRSRKFEIL